MLALPKGSGAFMSAKASRASDAELAFAEWCRVDVQPITALAVRSGNSSADSAVINHPQITPITPIGNRVRRH